jgi:hypothetical protein
MIIKRPVLGLVVLIVIAWVILILIAMILTYFVGDQMIIVYCNGDRHRLALSGRGTSSRPARWGSVRGPGPHAVAGV